MLQSLKIEGFRGCLFSFRVEGRRIAIIFWKYSLTSLKVVNCQEAAKADFGEPD